MSSAATDSMYRLLVQSVTDYAIYLLDLKGRVSNWNAGATRVKGYTAAEIVGRHFSCFYTPEDRDRGLPQEALRMALVHGRYDSEGWRVRRDGSRLWAQVTLDAVRDDDGCLVGFAKITRDRTDWKQQNDAAVQARSNLDLALAHMSQGLCLFNAAEELVFCNARFFEVFSVDPAAITPGMSVPDVLQKLLAEPHLTAAQIQERVLSWRQQRRDFLMCEDNAGRVMEISHRNRALALHHRLLPDGGWVSTVDDITERRAIEQKIVHLAHFDPLTGLANRNEFHIELTAALTTGAPCTLLYLDLDGFKPVNDSLGHAAGDQALQIVAERIRAEVRASDLAARLGGDEFAVLLRDCGSQAEVIRVVNRLIRAIRRPLELRGFETSVGVSIGVSLSPTDGQDADLLLRNADLALYAAKNGGRGRFCFYRHGMEDALLQRREIENDLRTALAGGQFTLHYQPITRRDRQQITSVEALLRWRHPVRGEVSPAEFIPIAEELGLMPEIGDWVLEKACAEAMHWPTGTSVAVNLSPTQFRLPDLMQRVTNILRATGLPASRLELEITETAMISDLAHATRVLADLREHGVEIALDDFGTGYSSLSFLRTLPFTRIKIDRSFIQDLGNKPAAKAIVRAVTGLCQSLGVATTAEGVETEEQLAILQREGCNEVQGYLVSRPVPPGDLRQWIAQYHDEQAMPFSPSAQCVGPLGAPFSQALPPQLGNASPQGSSCAQHPTSQHMPPTYARPSRQGRLN